MSERHIILDVKYLFEKNGTELDFKKIEKLKAFIKMNNIGVGYLIFDNVVDFSKYPEEEMAQIETFAMWIEKMLDIPKDGALHIINRKEFLDDVLDDLVLEPGDNFVNVMTGEPIKNYEDFNQMVGSTCIAVKFVEHLSKPSEISEVVANLVGGEKEFQGMDFFMFTDEVPRISMDLKYSGSVIHFKN